MPAFSFEALDAQGQTRKGLMEADTAKAARSLLRAQALVPLAVEPVQTGQSLDGSSSSLGQRLFTRPVFGASALAIWTRQIAGLVSSGLPLERALTALAEEADDERQRHLVAALRAEVNAGATFARALAQHPREFSDIYCAVIGAGEHSGDLGMVLERLADYTEKQVAVTAGALSILYGHEIGRKLQGYLDDPIPTWMENDANCAAMAEKLSGNAVKLDDFALITIDSGVGGALFLDGRIRRGKDWRAGELGMMIPNYETGGFHTMQDYLSTIVLAEEYAKEFDVPTGSIVPATLFHRLDEPRVRKIVDRWIDYLAIGIFNIVAVADPECVLLGGGICREQQLLPLVNAALDKIPQWSDFHTVVKRCRHTNNAGLIGAYYAFETEVEGMEKVPIR